MIVCDKCKEDTNLIGSATVTIEEVFEAGYYSKHFRLCEKHLKELRNWLKEREQ